MTSNEKGVVQPLGRQAWARFARSHAFVISNVVEMQQVRVCVRARVRPCILCGNDYVRAHRFRPRMRKLRGSLEAHRATLCRGYSLVEDL
jgi:hypothetical protein